MGRTILPPPPPSKTKDSFWGEGRCEPWQGGFKYQIELLDPEMRAIIESMTEAEFERLQSIFERAVREKIREKLAALLEAK